MVSAKEVLINLVGRDQLSPIDKGADSYKNLVKEAAEFGKFERNVVGGYVEEPVKGLHENILYFDFRSLYPSIIIAKNISPDTLTEDGDGETCHIAPESGINSKRSRWVLSPLLLPRY
jgi:DNA polymerase elongation subunit (family B)